MNYLILNVILAEYCLSPHEVPPNFNGNELNTKPHVLVHRPLSIVCPAYGSPLPVVKWFKVSDIPKWLFLKEMDYELNDILKNIVILWQNGLPINRLGNPNIRFSADGRRLTLRRSKPEDTGTYTCIAFNDVGKTEQDFNLTVQGLDKPHKLILFSFKVITIILRKITLVKLIQGFLTKADVSFLFSLLVPPTFPTDRNDINPNSISEILAGTTGELFCEVIGTPEPIVIWLKDGQILDILPHANSKSDIAVYDNHIEENQNEDHIEIIYNGRLLRIRNIRVDDSGRYTCIASNAAGTAEKNFEVEVLGLLSVCGILP